MYEQLAKEYVLDKQNQEFMKRANPGRCAAWSRGCNEAAERGLWAEPTRS